MVLFVWPNFFETTMSKLRFTGITISRAVLPFRIRFSHHLASRSETETILIALRLGEKAVGFGQALPRTYLTGETADSVVADIRNRWWARCKHLDVPEGCGFQQALEMCAPIFADADVERKNASYAAVEVAVIDAILRRSGLPAGSPECFGLAPLPLVGVIGGTGERKAGWLGRVMRWLGYRRFKVKVGSDWKADERRLAAVRRSIGPRAWLSVDANCAWEYDEAVHRMHRLRQFGVALIEEPLRQDCRAGVDYRGLEEKGGIAVMADESICTVADAESLLQSGSPSWWNLRLAKNGGFSGLSILSRLARDSGVGVYGGILVGETGLLAAAGRVGMAMTGAVCGEYGFSRVFLRNDPFRGSPAGYFGQLPPLTGSEKSLGVTLAEGGWSLPGEVVFRERM